MDPLLLLKALLALAVYPGGLLLVLCAAVTALVLPAAHRPGLTVENAVALTGFDVAAAMAPLPGSPLLDLPVAVSLPVLLLGLAAGFTALAPAAPWSRRRLAVALAPLLPALAMGSATGSLALASIASVPGGGLGAARILTAATLLLALPLLVPLADRGLTRAVRAAGASAAAVCAVSLVAGAAGAAPAVAGAVALAGAAVWSGFAALATRLPGVTSGLAVLAVSGGAVATVLALLG